MLSSYILFIWFLLGWLGVGPLRPNSYAKLDLVFEPTFQDGTLKGVLSVAVKSDSKEIINFKKTGVLSELTYLGQDSVPSVGEVTVLSLQVSPTDRLSFSYPLSDKKKFEGVYFHKEERAGTFYFYKEGSE